MLGLAAVPTSNYIRKIAAYTAMSNSSVFTLSLLTFCPRLWKLWNTDCVFSVTVWADTFGHTSKAVDISGHTVTKVCCL